MKQTIRLNERELHRLISESAKRVLNEDMMTYLEDSPDVDQHTHYMRRMKTQNFYVGQLYGKLNEFEQTLNNVPHGLDVSETVFNKWYSDVKNALDNLRNALDLGSDTPAINKTLASREADLQTSRLESRGWTIF